MLLTFVQKLPPSQAVRAHLTLSSLPGMKLILSYHHHNKQNNGKHPGIPLGHRRTTLDG